MIRRRHHVFEMGIGMSIGMVIGMGICVCLVKANDWRDGERRVSVHRVHGMYSVGQERVG